MDPSDDRMDRNAAALVASSAITAVLGLAFWLVAARILPTAEVGTGTAVVTSIVLLGNAATLGLRNGLIRFISAAGAAAGRFVGVSYALCGAVAVTLAVAFAFGTPWWATELAVLRDDPVAGAAFAGGTAVWTVFVLQDNVLTGLRRAVWVPVENLAYSVVKLGLLAALVGAGAWALPLAWSVPALLMIVPVNALIFRRLLPEQRRVAGVAADPIFTPRAVARFSAGDFGSDLVRLAGVEVVVLLVLGMRGATDTAYVFFAFTIAASAQLVSTNIVTAFVAEAAARPADAVELARRAGRNIARLVVPGAVAGALAAPFVLAAFGRGYADNTTVLLRLLLLDSIPLAVAALATGWARYERAAGTIVTISVGVAAAPLFGAAVLAPARGLDAIGWAALVGHSALAAVLLATTLRPVWLGTSQRVVARAAEVRGRVRRKRRERIVATVLDEIDAELHDHPPLHPRWLVPTDNDTAVVRVERPGAERIVKVALSDRAAAGLTRHVAAVEAVRAATAGAPVGRCVPRIVASVDCAGHRVVVEEACPGRPPLAADHRTLVAVADAVAAVHACTAVERELDAAVVAELVTDPVGVLSSDERLWPLLGEIDVLWRVLDGALRGRPAVLARTHGDCWIGNALVEEGPTGPNVTGLVDWEDSRALALPDVDLAHLWLTAQGDQIGPAVVDVLRGASATVFDDLRRAAPNPHLPVEAVVLLAWLDHAAAGLRRASRFGLGRWWLASNVEPVLRAVGELDPAAFGGATPLGAGRGPEVTDGR